MKTSPSIHILAHLAPDPGMSGMVFVSLILHLAAISALFFLPNLASTRTFYSPVYSVRLVNIQPSPPAAGRVDSKAETLPSPAPPPPAEKGKAKEKEKPVSLASKQK